MAFKIADGYVEVNVQYDRNRILEGARRAGESAGDRFAGNFNRSSRDRVRFSSRELDRDVDRAFSDHGRRGGRRFSESLREGLDDKSLTERFRTSGQKAGEGFLNGVDQDVTRRVHSMGRRHGREYGESVNQGMFDAPLEGVFTQRGDDAQRSFTNRFDSGVRRRTTTTGSAGGSNFMSAFGNMMKRSGKRVFKNFRKIMGKHISLTIGGLIAIAAGVFAALYPLASAAAGLMVFVFAGAIASIGVIFAAFHKDVQKRFSKLGDSISSTLKKISKPLRGTLTGFADDLQRNFDKITPNLEKAFKDAAPILSEFGTQITNAFGDWGPVIDDAMDAFEPFMKQFGPELSDWIGNIGDALQDMFGIVEENPGKSSDVLGWILNLIPTALNLINKFAAGWATFVDTWNADGSELRATVMGIVNIVKGGFLGAWELIKGVVMGLWDILKGVFSFLKNTFMGLGQILEGLFTLDIMKIWEGFGKIGQGILDLLVGLFEGVKDIVIGLVKGVWENIKGIFAGFGADAEEEFSKMWEGFLSYLNAVWDNIAGFFSGLGSSIMDILGWLYDNTIGKIAEWYVAIIGWFTKLWDKLVGNSIIPDMINSIINWFKSLWDKIVSIAKSIWNWMVDIWNKIKNTIVGVWKLIKGNVMYWVAQLRINIMRIVRLVRDWLTEKWNQVKNTIVGVWKLIKGNVMYWIAQLRINIMRIVRLVRNWLTEKWNQVKNTIVGVWKLIKGNVMYWVAQLRINIMRIVRLVRNWLTKKWNQVKNTIVGVWKLIKGNVMYWIAQLRINIKRIIREVRNWLTTKWNQVKNTVIGVWKLVSGRVKYWIAQLRINIKKIIREVKNWLTKKWNQAKNTVIGVWKLISGRVKYWISQLRINVKRIFREVKTWLENKVNGIRDSIVNKFKDFKDKVIDAFEKAKNGIKRVWKKVKEAAKKPVGFVVNTVYNNGIREMWNMVAGKVGLGTLDRVKGFARGGVLPGQSKAKDGDDQLVPMRQGEGVYVSEAMKNPYERARLHAVNKAAMKGDGQLKKVQDREKEAQGWRTVSKRAASNGIPFEPNSRNAENQGGNPKGGFSLGGIISSIGDKVSQSWNSIVGGLKDWASSPLNGLVDQVKNRFSTDGFEGIPYKAIKEITSNVLGFFKSEDDAYVEGGGWKNASQRLKGALAWARGEDGKPYQWGGGGNPSWDCSGFIAGIQKHLQGDSNPKGRLYTTFDFGMGRSPRGWKEGAKSPFMVGVTNKNKGHMAGSLIGTNVESSGGKGVQVGQAARGYNNNMFARQYGYTPVRGEATATSAGGADGWRQTVLNVLNQLGLGRGHAPNVLKAIEKESGGDPNAVNDWDSNARRGTPSKGLLQTIGPTFDAFAGRHRNKGITNPHANIYAAIRYARNRYGRGWSARMAQPGGYAGGGVVDDMHPMAPWNKGTHDGGGVLPDKGVAFNQSGKPEGVFTKDEVRELVDSTGNVYIDKVEISASDIEELNDLCTILNGVRPTSRKHGKGR